MDANTKKKKNIINEDQRRNIIDALKSGTVSRKMAAKTFNVNYNSICWIYRKYCMDGSTQKQQRGGKKPRKMNSLQVDFIKNLLDENCTLTLKQIKESINAEFKINVSVGTIHKYVGNFGYSFKRVARVAAVALLDESREVRKAYTTWFLKINNSNRQIIFNTRRFQAKLWLRYVFNILVTTLTGEVAKPILFNHYPMFRSNLILNNFITVKTNKPDVI